MRSYTCLGRRSRPVDFLNSFGEEVPISPLATTNIKELNKRYRTDHKETGQSMPPTFETEIRKEEEKMANKAPLYESDQ